MSSSEETRYLFRRVGDAEAACGLSADRGARFAHAAMLASYRGRLDGSLALDAARRKIAGDRGEDAKLSLYRWDDDGGRRG